MNAQNRAKSPEWCRSCFPFSFVFSFRSRPFSVLFCSVFFIRPHLLVLFFFCISFRFIVSGSFRIFLPFHYIFAIFAVFFFSEFFPLFPVSFCFFANFLPFFSLFLLVFVCLQGLECWINGNHGSHRNDGRTRESRVQTTASTNNGFRKTSLTLSAPKSRDSLRLRRRFSPLPRRIARFLRPQDARFPLRRKSLANGDFLCD